MRMGVTPYHAINQEENIECEFCNELFDYDQDYREHLKIHLEKWEEKSVRVKKSTM